MANAWAIWIMAGALLEAFALMSGRKGDTLSELIWRFLDGGPARWILGVAALAWAVVHFLGRGRWG